MTSREEIAFTAASITVARMAALAREVAGLRELTESLLVREALTGTESIQFRPGRLRMPMRRDYRPPAGRVP